MIKLERILVPTDFSEHSRQAGRYACELAKQFRAQVQVLHVVEPLNVPIQSANVLEQTQQIEEAARQELQQWMADDLAEVERVVRTTRKGEPFVEIVRYTREHNIDLITIGTHGRSGLVHTLIGSVAERVVRKAACPVLTVRAEDHHFVLP